MGYVCYVRGHDGKEGQYLLSSDGVETLVDDDSLVVIDENEDPIPVLVRKMKIPVVQGLTTFRTSLVHSGSKHNALAWIEQQKEPYPFKTCPTSVSEIGRTLDQLTEGTKVRIFHYTGDWNTALLSEIKSHLNLDAKQLSDVIMKMKPGREYPLGNRVIGMRYAYEPGMVFWRDPAKYIELEARLEKNKKRKKRKEVKEVESLQQRVFRPVIRPLQPSFFCGLMSNYMSHTHISKIVLSYRSPNYCPKDGAWQLAYDFIDSAQKITGKWSDSSVLYAACENSQWMYMSGDMLKLVIQYEHDKHARRNLIAHWICSRIQCTLRRDKKLLQDTGFMLVFRACRELHTRCRVSLQKHFPISDWNSFRNQ